MTWRYQIIHYSGYGYGLHEVYYDADGNINGWTKDPTDFGSDEDEGGPSIIRSLEMALADCKHHPILEESQISITNPHP